MYIIAMTLINRYTEFEQSLIIIQFISTNRSSMKSKVTYIVQLKNMVLYDTEQNEQHEHEWEG